MTSTDLEEWVQQDRRELLTDLVQLAQQPAPPGDVEERARFLEQRFQDLEVTSTYRDSFGNLVVHVGDRSEPVVSLTANLESPFDHSTDHTVQVDDEHVQGPGVVDNALGLATLLSVTRYQDEVDLPDLLLVATSNRRGQGARRGIQEVIQGSAVEIGAALCLDTKGLGRLDHQSLGTNEMTLQIEGPRTTTWPEEPSDNPILIMAQAVNELEELSERVEARDESVHLNVGTINGGESSETVPYECELGFQIRSRSEEAMRLVRKEVVELTEGIRSRSPHPVHLEETVREPAGGLDRDHWLVEAVASVHQNLGLESRFGATSSDASQFIRAGIPAVTIGLGEEEHVYREEEQLLIDTLPEGQSQVMKLVETLGEEIKPAD